MDVCLTDTDRLLDRFLTTRSRTRMLFNCVKPEAFHARPIPLRHPVQFYEGHVAAFNANMLAGAGADVSCLGEDLSRVFARGIDPGTAGEAVEHLIPEYPPRERVLDYAREVDQLMLSALSDGEPHDAFPTCIEHEEMHQETLVYMLHHLPLELLNVPEGYRRPALDNGSAAHRTFPNRWRSIPAGMTELGARPQDGFGWDNEFPRTPVFVGDFEIQEHKITNGEFLAFVEAGGYEQSVHWSRAAWKILHREQWRHPQLWRKHGDGWVYRALFAEIELPLAWPVLVSHDEACAYANWKSLRLPTEAEYTRAASFAAEPPIGPSSEYLAENILARDLPVTGNYDFKNWDLQPCSSGAPNSVGVRQLVGNGWEWTSTPFFGLPGFKPMLHYPGYSADFFDGLHYILKGASPVTARGLVRPSFRNWFRHHYRYAYTTFRCVRESRRTARKS